MELPWTTFAQKYEQMYAQLPADVYEARNNQGDTAGSTILHQQLTLVVSVALLAVVIASDVLYGAALATA